MDLEQITREYKRNLRRASHGGEIYRINKHEDERFLDFSTNINPIFDVAKYSHIIQENLKQITKYPDSNSLQLKKALIKSISNVVSEENILIGAGAMDIIATFCDVFIDPGDEVIIAQPTFAEYQWAIEKNGGQVVHYHRIPEKNFNLTPKDLLNHVTPKTKAIFICNPNNPNGNLDENDSIRKIMNEASKLDIVVFLDEAFIEFTGTEEYFINHLGDFDNLVICRSFTKFYAIPGLRVGYGVSSPQIIEILERNHNLWSTNFIGQLLVQEMLMDNDLKRKTVEFFTRERQFLSSELKKIPQL